MKIFKAHEDAGLLIKGISETVENEVKKQKGRFLGILVDVALLANGDNLTYFNSFEVEYILKQIKKFIKPKILQQLFLECKHTVQ